MMVIRKSGKACCILLVLFHTSLSAGDFRNWKELRDTGIEKQNLDVSCAAAAAATILRAYYGVAVSEQEILAEVIKAGLNVTASDLERDGKILFILPKDDARNVNVERGFFHAPRPNTVAIQHLMLRSTPRYQY